MPLLDREEYIEQAYFFQAFRERVLDGQPAQDVLGRISEELLSTTKLPMAISFLHSEIKLSGLMGPAMERLSHYFTPFQSYVVTRAEEDRSRFAMDQALLILEREARYKAAEPTPAGLFVYQFEALSRNRLGWIKGLLSIAADPTYDEHWCEYIERLVERLGEVDFADLIFARSAYYVSMARRRNPDFVPKRPVLFGEKEGKIARAHHGRDPLFLFQALQRQLGYPEVPRPKRVDEVEGRLALLETRVAQLENRLKVAESELQGDPLDIGKVLVRPEDTAGIPKGWGSKTGVEPPDSPPPGSWTLDFFEDD